MKPSREPVTGAVIGHEFESSARAVSEDEDDSGEGIGIELCFAESTERINALAEIDRLHGEQNFELRSELDHRSQERRKLEQRAESESASSAGRTRLRRAPSARSSNKRQSADGSEGIG